ncbi:hypothetical protein JM18_008164 [Phytophthora kernoviae]|uniref:Uncharacterized protein n=2 Tax=Phytophthora kernoviae TaxID=325452 RepID=A0A921SAT6_9STRA|nr:hypothetical protein G195_009851 [Phytophthora kernoviae 00238/432]KAG2515428.1 hypothetical protein JM18_008164 [Phytophthora kernoviae]
MSILGCSPPLIPQPIASLDEKPVLPTNRSLSDLLKSSEKVGAKDAGCKVPQGGDDDQQTTRLVLSSIELALAANPSPPPYEYSNVPQNVTIDWDNYQLEVRYAGLLTCTVQVFLFQRGVYLVEFRRGHVDIFQFKRFYEKIRAYIVDCMEGGTRESLPTFRKRNNSISEPCF